MAMLRMPEHLQKGIEKGDLTKEQLRELVTWEARAIGLDYEKAVKLAKERRLPNSPIGVDIGLLLQLLST